MKIELISDSEVIKQIEKDIFIKQIIRISLIDDILSDFCKFVNEVQEENAQRESYYGFLQREDN